MYDDNRRTTEHPSHPFDRSTATGKRAILHEPVTQYGRSDGIRAKRAKSELRTICSLDASTRTDMWRLFSASYSGVERASFERDLAEKRHVILLRDRGNESIQGFSTIAVDTDRIHGRRVIGLFSGDTIVDPAYWGQRCLHRAFISYLFFLKLRHPSCPVYWYLISKGYKTYLLLTRNVPRHYPRYDRPTPRFEQALLDTFSRRRFGEAYDRERGVLVFPSSKGRLREGVAPIHPHLLKAPDVRFFVERNPRHELGEELCCVGRVDLQLFGRFAVRTAGRPVRRLLKTLGRSLGVSSESA